MKNAAGDLVGAIEFRPAGPGGGGFVTGLDFSTDGQRMVHNTDVFGGYVRDATDTEHQQLIRSDRFLASEYDPRPNNNAVIRAKTNSGNNNGTFGTRIAPSNKDIAYFGWNGFLYRTGNGFTSIQRTVLPAMAFLSDTGDVRRFNRVIDVHPTDANIVLVGTNGDGCYYSTNGFLSSYVEINLPDTVMQGNQVPAPGKYLVAFDPNTPTNVYIHVYGVGLYRSTTGLGADNFSLVSGGPEYASCLLVGPDGAVYVVQYRHIVATITNAVKKLVGETWSSIANTTSADQFAIDPFDPDHLVWCNENGGFYQSRDGGATHTGHTNYRGDGETKWFSNRSKAMYPAQIVFDPVVPNKLWVAEGISVSWSTPPSGSDTWIWHDYSRGNRELVATMGMSIPGVSTPFFGCMDKPFWRMENLRKDTNNWSYVPVGAPNASAVAHLRSVDYAIDDPNFIGAIMDQDGRNGYSTDQGRTFTPFPSPPSWGIGGNIAIGNKNNILISGGNNAGGYWTKTGGANWNPIEIGGYSPVTHWRNAYYVHRRDIAADKERPGVFACFLNNIIPGSIPDTIGRDIAGLWLNTNGGEGEWEQKQAGVIQTQGGIQQFWQAKLMFVPGFAGEMLYADCDGGTSNVFMWLTNDGATKQRIRTDITNIEAFDCGKPFPGQTRPAVYFYGNVGSVRGLYASFDWFDTAPILLTRFPAGSLDRINRGLGLFADLNVFGRVYFAFGGSSWAVGEYGKRFNLV